MPCEPTYKSEADVKTQVKKLLKEHGWFHWMPGANGFGMQGVSDFLALKNGVFLALETKFGKGTLTVLQRCFLRQVKDHGGLAFVVSETNLLTFSAFCAWFNAMPCVPGYWGPGTVSEAEGANFMRRLAFRDTDSNEN